MHFLTNEDSNMLGRRRLPDRYVEPQEGKLRLAAQDIKNKDKPHGLTQGPLRGGYNGKFYDSTEVVFRSGKWYLVEALFRLNTLDTHAGMANADGVVRGWVDGKLMVDRTDVVLCRPLSEHEV